MALLKIDGFDGKFGAAVASSVHPVTKPVAETVATTSVRNRPDSSFKIKDTLSEVSRMVQPVIKSVSSSQQPEEVKSREQITVDSVVNAIKRYIEVHHPESIVSIALETHVPSVEGEQITIWVDNQLQLDKLESIQQHFHHAVAKLLNNGFISLQFRLFEAEDAHETRKLFTAGEKFAHFVELNSAVAKLRNIFGLELD